MNETTDGRVSPERQKFTKALASVLAVKPADLRRAEDEATPEPPSPHTRYTYDPEEDRS
jgi:hypothetical protein